MILVVADTSPINYLIQIGAIDLLPRFFDEVAIPAKVLEELLHDSSPSQVKAWASNLPVWAVKRSAKLIVPLGLHPGETEAIALAKELQAFAVLLDDGDARVVARSLGVPVTGTIGFLERAAAARLINLESAFNLLQKTTYRASPQLLKAALERNRKLQR